jgi:hypothetical protein
MMQPWATEFFTPVLQTLERAFRRLEMKVPPPVRLIRGDIVEFRYTEQTIQQAIVQKLARTISGLHAVQLLLDRGLFQEQGVIQRVLDELQEDVVFLSLAIIRNDITPLHREYLQYFYAEEFIDPSDVMGSHQSRGMVFRKKIHRYLDRQEGASVLGKRAAHVLTKFYSGFVHAASPQTMDMCAGSPPRFDLSGEFKHLRTEAYADNALNYFLRALFAMAFGAKALGDEELFEMTRRAAGEVEAAMGLHS